MTDRSKKKRPAYGFGMLGELWRLGMPTMLEQALQTAAVYIDTAMVGHIGAAASAAVGLTTTVNWLFGGIFFAAGMGLLSAIARYTGEGRPDMAKKVSAQGIWVVLILGAAETAAAFVISPWLPVWMGAAPELHRDASLYFFIVSVPLLLRGSLSIFSTVLRANKDTKTPMTINVGANLLNILLNQLLIGRGCVFSLRGISVAIPGAGLGVAGAAVATAVSQGLGGILIFAAAMRNPLSTLKGQSKKPDRKVLGNCFRVAFPLLGEQAVTEGGYIVFSSLIAQLGTLPMAAHSIAITVEQAFYVPGYGMQTAVSTLAGNAFGKRDRREMKKVLQAGLWIAVSVMSVMSVFLFFGSPWIMGLFSGDEAVIGLGAAVLKIVAVSEPVFAALIIFEGMFHGLGRTKAPFFFSLFSMWGIRIFMTWMLTGRFHAGLEAAWICMILDNMTRCCLLAFWYFRQDKAAAKTEEKKISD